LLAGDLICYYRKHGRDIVALSRRENLIGNCLLRDELYGTELKIMEEIRESNYSAAKSMRLNGAFRLSIYLLKRNRDIFRELIRLYVYLHMHMLVLYV